MGVQDLMSRIANGWVAAKREPFTGHPIAVLLRQDLVLAIKEALGGDDKYIVKASAGAGNWADVPWLSILNPNITQTTQSGIYPVYLFCSDGSGVYLSLCFGTTDLKQQYGTAQAKQKARALREQIRQSDARLEQWGETIDLHSSTPLGRSYEWASAGAKFYPTEAMPRDEALLHDLQEMMSIYTDLNASLNETRPQTTRPTTFSRQPKMTAIATPLSKPFLLLAGISGTGKTRFVREQAKATGQLDSTYCLTSVRPDWHEPSDLLGYVSRLSQSGEAHYVTTDVLKFISKAWRGLVDAGLSVEVQTLPGEGECLVVTGESATLESAPPYWLCLDEMNLAPVEQYFADYLSVLETREWHWQGDHFTYRCDALLKPATLDEIVDKNQLRRALGFESPHYEALWQHIETYGLGLPLNLLFAGTVNMDETTHGFSRKVIDRALSIDFGEFFPNDYATFFAPDVRNKPLSYPRLSHVSQADLHTTIDSDGARSIAFLTQINQVLSQTPFELAYRALNELLLSVASSQPQDEPALQAVWDDFMMCKVLPRIEGDRDKLTTATGEDLLDALEETLANQWPAIWSRDGQASPLRPDLLREGSGNDNASVVWVACRSQRKVAWMKQRLAHATFSSFWP